MDEKSCDIEISYFLVVPDIRRTNRRSCDIKHDDLIVPIFVLIISQEKSELSNYNNVTRSPIFAYFALFSRRIPPPWYLYIMQISRGGVLRENKAKHTRVNTPRKHSLAISTVEGSEMCLIKKCTHCSLLKRYCSQARIAHGTQRWGYPIVTSFNRNGMKLLFPYLPICLEE